MSQKHLPALRHYAEYAVARGLLACLSCLPPVWASNLGGWVARTIGPHLPVSHVADMNLGLAMPKLDEAARKRIVRDVWDNLGRTIGEFCHLSRLKQDTPSGPGWSIDGAPVLEAIREENRPVIFFSGHIGNWEMLPPVVARYGLPFASFYRAAGNPLIDRLIRRLRIRAMGEDVPMFAKGAKGARQALRHLAHGHHLGILGDQKMNDGIECRFFNLPAMTASAAATFAHRYDCPIVTGRIVRLGPARLHLEVGRVLRPDPRAPRQDEIGALTQQLNDQMEEWIREIPGSWLWLHRRWPKALYARQKR
ncbi:LpxL/LpxP family acyltransferase [Swaminathania salitolerans]|uniref:Lipid A biosynthesis lauroyl acyltransferase n=1 Tax=Swaminathania salitolerans TaxID=182838 RepID=A0A511BPP6_9PROT|nr:lauroyl acyltransferase [Swaminathania salitolerans]GBQ16176.1 lipid A biosynthesis lauroyl acyltransferase [Swaminathania salitolerans LMG 21291]GEL01624.1 lipid A biosynthesis lauroyl acyltransferase [Swaminathania salitolerans]